MNENLCKSLKNEPKESERMKLRNFNNKKKTAGLFFKKKSLT